MSQQSSINSYISHLRRQIVETALQVKQKQSKFGNEILNVDLLSELLSNRVEAKAYTPVGEESVALLLGKNAPADSTYVAETYGQISQVDKKPTVVEGLVFDNNREFDLKV